MGEQLQNSYNQCDWCDTFSNPSNGPRSFQVTPQLFELYGFVELIPQRWVIPCHRLFFDIDEDGSDLVVDFVVPPSRDGIAFLKDQIEVLQHFETEHRMRSDIPEHELEAIMKLHTAMESAFTLAIEQSKGQITDEVWHWDEDDWYMEDDEESEDDDVEDPDDEESEVDDEEEPDAEENEDDDEEGPGHQQDYSEL